jgi:hypothetical protein
MRQLEKLFMSSVNTNKNYLCAYFQFANRFPASQAHVKCMVIQITFRFQELCCQLLCMLCLLKCFQHISTRHSHAELIVILIKCRSCSLNEVKRSSPAFSRRKKMQELCFHLCILHSLSNLFRQAVFLCSSYMHHTM